jgi:transcriptional regulator with XRE-family HTH domain
MTIGGQISSQRKRKGITQEMLSEISGISLRTIQRIENGQSVPRAYTLKKLADELNMNLEELTEIEIRPVETVSVTGAIPILQRMNSAGLTVLLLPVLPLFIVLMIWLKRKKDLTIDTIGKRIISFQIIWLVLTVFVLMTTKMIYYYLTGQHVIGHFSPLLPAYLLMLASNLILVIHSAQQLQKQKLSVYQFVPALL